MAFNPSMGAARPEGSSQSYAMPTIIAASSAGTMIEWYDFYLFGSLATIMAANFFPKGNDVAALLATLATFGTGFAVRPFGALVFGRIGDLIGRKYAFILTVSIMGGATAIIGLLPRYESIGLLAPLILVLLRLLQGLALGGEYGGAAIYVAEHAPDHRRGYFTSFIQTTATVGLFASLVVILAVRLSLGEQAFTAWAWRIPFLLSLLLVAVALYIRWRLKETPLFSAMKAAGKTSTAPLKDSLGSRRNWRLILLALFGATAGEAVVWYTRQFYALTFLQSILKVDLVTSYEVVAVALLLGTPFFLVFGTLSDRIGRKRIMMAGCLIAAIAYYPIYSLMAAFAKPVNPVALTLLVLVQVLFVTMVYGPIAAFLVEFFPAKIRYTSLSLPYHLGNGEFGGWLPFIAASIVAATGNIYAGLVYPIAIALLTFVVGTLFLPETREVQIWKEIDPSEVPPSARRAGHMIPPSFRASAR
jgi:MFS family permease